MMKYLLLYFLWFLTVSKVIDAYILKNYKIIYVYKDILAQMNKNLRNKKVSYFSFSIASLWVNIKAKIIIMTLYKVVGFYVFKCFNP